MIMTDAGCDKDAGRLLYKIFTSHFIARVWKGYSRFAWWESVGDRTETSIFWPHCYDRHVVFFSFLDAQPEALGSTLLGAGFQYCILSASSLDPNSSEPKGPFGLMWLSLPHLLSNWMQLNWLVELNCQLPLPLPTVSTSVLTALYNSSTPTRSPTRSLKSNV